MDRQLSARELGRQAIINTVPESEWQQNWQFSRALIEEINSHRIMSHPIMQALNGGQLSFEQMRVVHLEFFHAFAQVFTDAVIQAMFTASQLESRLGPAAKPSARFLLQFNLLEELGFKPGFGSDGSYEGNPNGAHYAQFCDTLAKLHVDPKKINQYVPMASSLACRATFESCYGDHLLMTTLLAVSETVFHDYAGIWATGVAQSTDIDVTKGYHSIHVEDETGVSIEDGHSEDAWILFSQAVTSDRYDVVKHHIYVWLNTWTAFLDDLLAGRFLQNQPQAA
ncbi:hypothetical protein [Dendronalium sp. ChiSLP03b]|uniref:hypothetical protein n=1 Tax=Dendronalium sp. ChiSLP03b TaxID=3075381 RepID=UPI002AD517D1|nr:hypothetical protein [Dendronalium sp. ChiSLP03b]MDZ8205087.1 hypothetical protein [Dendronalium sp. ChiSLP03b]